MITPFQVFLEVIVTLIGCLVVANVCTWIADRYCRVPGSCAGAGVISDVEILLVFASGPILGLPAYWLVYVVMANGRYWW